MREANSPPDRTRARADVEQRRRAIVALLRQHPDGLTAREIWEATGISRNLTASALSGLLHGAYSTSAGTAMCLRPTMTMPDRSRQR